MVCEAASHTHLAWLQERKHWTHLQKQTWFYFHWFTAKNKAVAARKSCLTCPQRIHVISMGKHCFKFCMIFFELKMEQELVILFSSVEAVW